VLLLETEPTLQESFANAVAQNLLQRIRSKSAMAQNMGFLGNVSNHFPARIQRDYEENYSRNGAEWRSGWKLHESAKLQRANAGVAEV
jgi:hypothetical protein